MAENYVTKYVIWTYQNTELFVYHWQHAHASFDVTCFPVFVGSLNVISNVLSICLLTLTCYPDFRQGSDSREPGALQVLYGRPYRAPQGGDDGASRHGRPRLVLYGRPYRAPQGGDDGASRHGRPRLVLYGRPYWAPQGGDDGASRHGRPRLDRGLFGEKLPHL